jgi:glycosyltransferase involved in cell wall biosynthesis
LSWCQLKIAGVRQMIALHWQPGMRTGWEVFGYNLVLELCRKPTTGALLFSAPDIGEVANPLHRLHLRQALHWHNEFNDCLAKIPGRNYLLDIPLLQPLANDLATTDSIFRGTPQIGVIFSESTAFSAQGLARSSSYDRIFAGSTWNAEMLKSHGISQAQSVFQGFDPTLFHPAPKAHLFPDRFVIFSGGKLEYRKGHDIVAAAFKNFKARHPEAFLLTHWQSRWPQYALGMEQVGYLHGYPQVDADGQVLISPWLANNGIEPPDHHELGSVPNYLMPQVIREADVAVFPNRCEAGTNLVAMECMACGVPTILSANTGHLDLIDDSRCYVLRSQGLAKPTSLFPGADGWGESRVDEVVEHLEAVYQNRDESLRRGATATKFMEDWTWEKQVRRLVTACG